jgi:hypothetical protein
MSLIGLILLSGQVFAVATAVKVSIDGQIVSMEKTQPFTQNGNTYVPLLAVVSAYGAVALEKQANFVVLQYQDITLKIPVSEKYLLKNGLQIETSAVPIVKNNCIFIPISPVIKALGGTVVWDPNTKTIQITRAVVPRGVVDPDFVVTVHNKEKAWAGTTLFSDNHNPAKTRVVEVNMQGEIVWEYVLPAEFKQFTNPGFDVERLANKNILITLPRKGIIEVNRKGEIVWSYMDAQISHDSDRLPNGNTLMVFGCYDTINDAQVKEISPSGEIVWKWLAADYFTETRVRAINNEGWTHTNAVTRLENGNTLISLRNFNFVAEVEPSGAVVKKMGVGIVRNQHDPEIQANGNLLLATHGQVHKVFELNPLGDKVVWQYEIDTSAIPVRDANRLPNGNVLITGSNMIREVTPQKEIVWQLDLKNTAFNKPIDSASLGFYKAERISYFEPIK